MASDKSKSNKGTTVLGSLMFLCFNSIWQVLTANMILFMFIFSMQSYWNFGRNEEYIWCEWLSSVVYKLFCRWHGRASRKPMDILCKADFDNWHLSRPPLGSPIYISFFQKNNASSNKKFGCFLNVDDIEEVFIRGHSKLLYWRILSLTWLL